jgi:hypothetical protein
MIRKITVWSNKELPKLDCRLPSITAVAHGLASQMQGVAKLRGWGSQHDYDSERRRAVRSVSIPACRSSDTNKE